MLASVWVNLPTWFVLCDAAVALNLELIFSIRFLAAPHFYCSLYNPTKSLVWTFTQAAAIQECSRTSLKLLFSFLLSLLRPVPSEESFFPSKMTVNLLKAALLLLGYATSILEAQRRQTVYYLLPKIHKRKNINLNLTNWGQDLWKLALMDKRKLS